MPGSSLISIYKSFVKPNLDYGNVIFDKAYNNSFQQRLESFQYKASLAITGATGRYESQNCRGGTVSAMIKNLPEKIVEENFEI